MQWKSLKKPKPEIKGKKCFLNHQPTDIGYMMDATLKSATRELRTQWRGTDPRSLKILWKERMIIGDGRTIASQDLDTLALKLHLKKEDCYSEAAIRLAREC